MNKLPLVTLRVRKWAIVSFAVFVFGIIAVTSRDYMVHGIHYDYGLLYDWGWHSVDLIFHQMELQTVVFASALIARSMGLFLVYEAFTLTCGQDLVFYGLWHTLLRCGTGPTGVFPSGNWTWMPFYSWFGAWTTTMQIGFTVIVVFMVVVAFRLAKSVVKEVWTK